jgi:hypothetical protein
VRHTRFEYARRVRASPLRDNKERMSMKFLCTVAALAFATAPASGQKFDVTPLVGYRAGAAIDVQLQGNMSKTKASIEDGLVYGVAAGIRFDDELDACQECAVIEFRWMRQDSHLGLEGQGSSTVARPSVTVNHFLGDFTREWFYQDRNSVRPYLTLSLGATHISAPTGSATRFATGIGTGFKIFPGRWYGIRFQVQYLPTWINADVRRIICAAGCVAASSGSVLHQVDVTIGPTFRF